MAVLETTSWNSGDRGTLDTDLTKDPIASNLGELTGMEYRYYNKRPWIPQHTGCCCVVCAHLCTDILAPGERALNNACCHHHHDSWRASCRLQAAGAGRRERTMQVCTHQAVGVTDRVTKEWRQIVYSGCFCNSKISHFLVLNVNRKVCFPDERQKIEIIGAHIDTCVVTLLVHTNLNPMNAHKRRNKPLNFNIDKIIINISLLTGAYIYH
jgi:hypothetical protein